MHSWTPAPVNAPLPRIAISGGAGYFPGARGLDEYWHLICNGQIATGPPPKDRTELWRAMREPALADRVATLIAGYLDQIDLFDAEYFGISPKEASRLDPQQRLMLTTVHDALEDAWLKRETLRERRVGVFVGASTSDHMRINATGTRSIDAYYGIGNALSVIAGRISYFYNFSGPSLMIDTACSSSLTAVHYAIQALRLGEIDLALVGGVNVLLSPDLTLSFSDAGMLSRDGRSHSFGEKANGYARAEAVGVVVLEREEDARRIRCFVSGTAINQDGRSNGITAPNGISQTAVIRAALERAGVAADAVGYIEAHGTGTTLGDAIELEALGRVFGATGGPPCYVGSAKANIGHGEAAAGICGLLKGLLIVEKGMVPPHPVPPPWNPIIERIGNLRLSSEGVALPLSRPAVGVSSFGFGGSNAHVVLEPAPERNDERADVDLAIVPISSHTQALLAEDARALSAYLIKDQPTLRSTAAVLTNGRDNLPFRRAYVVGGIDELAKALDLVAADTANASVVHTHPAKGKMAFMFTGQGSQRMAMGRDIYMRSPEFRSAFDEVAELASSKAGFDVSQGLYGSEPWSNEQLSADTHRAQLALFCFETALASLWRALGVIPDFVIGHSIGEISAHAFAGSMAMSDAVALVHTRGMLMQRVPHDGAMIAVLGEPSALSTWLAEIRPPLFIAAFNSTRAAVISGDRAAIADTVTALAGSALKTRPLRTSHAFHSPQFSFAAGELQRVTTDIRCEAATIPVVSTLDGRLVEAAFGSEYWAHQMIEPVRFGPGVEELHRRGVETFLEIGPGTTLTSLVGRDLGQAGCAIASIGEQASWRQILVTAAQLFERGVEVRLDVLGHSVSVGDSSPPPRALRRTQFSIEARAESYGSETQAPFPGLTASKPPTAAVPQAVKLGLIEAQLRVIEKQLGVLASGSPDAAIPPKGLS